MGLRKPASGRLAAALFAAFLCFACHTAAHASGCDKGAPPDNQDPPGTYTVVGVAPSSNINTSSILRGKLAGNSGSIMYMGYPKEPLRALWISKRNHYLRLAVRADSDGAGQSLTGDSITNPTSCHGVVVDSGNKVHVETDFEGSGEMPLTLIRGYNKASAGGLFESQWTSSFNYGVAETGGMCPEPEEDFILPERCWSGRLLVSRPGGVGITLKGVEGQPGMFRSGLYWAQELKNAQGTRTGWEVHTEDDRLETYDAQGRPITLLNKHGIGWTYTWIDNYYPTGPKVLDRIDHTSGRYVKFNYVNHNNGITILKRLSSIQDPNFGIHNYTFVDDAGGGRRLTGVTSPNGDTRTYHYELTGTLRHALTGVSVNGVRYSTYEYYPDTGEPGGYQYDPNPTDPSNPDPRASEWQDGRVKETRLAQDVEKTTFSYARNTVENSQTTTVTNALGATWTYKYGPGSWKQLTSVTATAAPGPNSCPNTPRQIEYDPLGNPTTSIDWLGNKTRLVYNSNRQVIREITGEGAEARSKIIEWTTDPNDPQSHNEIAREDYYDGDIGVDLTVPISATKVATTVYDYYDATHPAKYRLEYVTHTDVASGESRSTHYSYALHSNGIVSRMDVDGPRTQDEVTTFYSDKGDVTRTENAFGHAVVSDGHNGFGLPWHTTDINGVTTTFGYDAVGQMTSRSRTVSGQAYNETFAYNGFGAMTLHAYPGQTHSWYYAVNGRLWGEQLGSDTDSWKAYEYDLLGNKTKYAVLQNVYVTDVQCIEAGGTFSQCRVIAPDPAVKYQRSWTYYTDGRVKSESGNNGQLIQFTYDDVNKKRTVIDPLGRSTTSTLNSRGQVVLTESPAPNGGTYKTQFRYDAFGNTEWVKDPKSYGVAGIGETTYVYNAFGELTETYSPDTGLTTYDHASAGAQVTMTRSNGAQTIYQYDGLRRLTSVQAGGLTETHTYDDCGDGHLCSVVSKDGGVTYASSSYTYTEDGQLDVETELISNATYTVDHGYDIHGRVTSVAYGGDVLKPISVQYVYNAEDEVTGVTATINGATSNVATVFSYLPFGPRTSMRYGNLAVRTQTYDVDYRLKSTVSTGIQSLTYTLNANDEITNIANGQQTVATQTYQYDEASRLKSATRPGLSESWEFDPNGNREKHFKNGALDDYEPQLDSNRIPEVVGATDAADRLMEHDELLGNITSYKTGSQMPYTYAYDPFNRVKTVTNGSLVTAYTYDSAHRRVRKTGPVSGDVRYLHTGSGLAAETAPGSTTLSTFYIRVGGELIGLIKPVAVNGVLTPKLFFVHTDHLGRPEVVTDAAKVHKWKAWNYAYDREIALTSIEVPYLHVGFPGQYFDAESGLWYNHHRYYDAATGRYITSDPIGLAGGLNTYAYVSNRPVLAVDQLGLSEADVSAAWKWLGGAYPQLTRGVSVSGSRILDYTGASGFAPGGGTVYIRQSYYDDNLTSWQLYEMTYTLIHESLHEYVFNEVGWLYALRHGGDDELHGWIRDKAADIMLEHEGVKEGKTDLSNPAGCIK